MSEPRSSSFTTVSYRWRYAIDAAPKLPNAPKGIRFIVAFDPQPEADCWLAHCGGNEIRILKSPTVTKLLNEALAAGLYVETFNLETKDLLKFNEVPAPAPEPVKPSTQEA